VKKTLSILAATALLLSAGSAMATQEGPFVDLPIKIGVGYNTNISVSGEVSFTIPDSDAARAGVTDATSTYTVFNNGDTPRKITAGLPTGDPMPSGQTLKLTAAAPNSTNNGTSVGEKTLTDTAETVVTGFTMTYGTGGLTYKWTPGYSTVHEFTRTVTLTVADQ
jgi:hypothetical protein